METSICVLILSDTHGVLDSRIEAEVAVSDAVVHAGDIGARNVLDALKSHNDNVIAVRGNNDVREKWHEPDWRLLETLPWEATLPLPGGELVVFHGHRYGNPGRQHDRMRRDFPNARVLVYGHSHRRCTDKSGIPWVVNPGAAGRAQTFGGPSFCLLRASRDHWVIETKQFPSLSQSRKPRPRRRKAE